MKLWDSDRPEFIERVASLAGGTTYRMPVGSRGTKHDQMPNEHAVAAALAYGRRGPDDIAPDVGYAWAIQCDAGRQEVCRRLAVALRQHATRSTPQHRLAAAFAGWDVLIWDRGSVKPASCPGRDWSQMLLAAICTLHNAAWDGIAQAERAYHCRAVDETVKS